MKISSEEIYRRLEEYFRPWECTDVFPKIGLQLHYCDFPQKVYTATFASDEVFTFLKEKGVKNALLFTHHPAPQKTDLNLPAPPVSQENIDFMKENGISFFSYHIPLDRNSPYAPGFNLAKAMGAEPYAEFYEQNGVKMGLVCRFEAETLKDIKNALENKRQARLTPAALEVLAIVAYNQPVTKAFVEQVRGTDSSSVVNSLVERELLCEAGRLELPGRPMTYRTTENFLRCFDMASLEELPRMPTEDGQMRLDDPEELWEEYERIRGIPRQDSEENKEE